MPLSVFLSVVRNCYASSHESSYDPTSTTVRLIIMLTSVLLLAVFSFHAHTSPTCFTKSRYSPTYEDCIPVIDVIRHRSRSFSDLAVTFFAAGTPRPVDAVGYDLPSTFFVRNRSNLCVVQINVRQRAERDHFPLNLVAITAEEIAEVCLKDGPGRRPMGGWGFVGPRQVVEVKVMDVRGVRLSWDTLARGQREIAHNNNSTLNSLAEA